MATRLRNNFLTGLIICAPMAITIYLTWTFIRWADSWVKPYLPDRYNPEAYLKFAVPGTGLLIAVTVVVETMKQLEAQMLMRNYEGFIK